MIATRIALLLFLPCIASAQTSEATTTTLLPAASVSATVGGSAGYWLGTKWRFLGSNETEVHRREAPLLGITAGALAAAAAACAVSDDTSVTTKRCLDGAVIGTVPAVVIAGAVGSALPRKWRRWVMPLVYGLFEGGVTAWNAARD